MLTVTNPFQTITQRESVLARLKENNADLEKDVKRLQERKSLLEKVSSTTQSFDVKFLVSYLRKI